MKHLAQVDLGDVSPPQGVDQFAGGNLAGMPLFLNVILKTLIMGAAIYALINFILAGYGFISAGGDPKRIQDSTARIWQTILGLIITAGAFVIAAIVGRLVFGDANAILQFKIFGPP